MGRMLLDQMEARLPALLPLRELRLGELGAGAGDARRVVVRALAAAQDDVAVVVAARLHDRHLPGLVHGEEVVLLAGGRVYVLT